MSEKDPLPKSHEHLTSAHESHEAAEKLKELREKAERAADNQEQIPELEQTAEQEAVASEDYTVGEKAPQEPSSLYVSRELKAQTFQRTMTRIRKALPLHERTLSRVIHQPVVDAVSRAGAKTVARPSGLLGGSIVAFIGSSAFLWAAKRYGFAYNYLLFFLLFIGGFAIGMTIELVWFSLRRKRAE